MEMPTTTVTVDTLRSYMARGFTLVDVDSSEDHLLLTLADADTTARLALDRDGAGELFRNPQLIEAMPATSRASEPALQEAAQPTAPRRNL